MSQSDLHGQLGKGREGREGGRTGMSSSRNLHRHPVCFLDPTTHALRLPSNTACLAPVVEARDLTFRLPTLKASNGHQPGALRAVDQSAVFFGKRMRSLRE